MNQQILNKYFSGTCTQQELGQVFDWFKTSDGQAYLERKMDEDFFLFMDGDEVAAPIIDGNELFDRIQHTKKQAYKKNPWLYAAVASVVLLVAIIGSLLSGGQFGFSGKEHAIATKTYITYAGQRKVFTLSDGSIIHLNEESKLIVPIRLETDKRTVKLKGEAFFEVAKDPDRPFIVYTNGALVKVLGTKFNVKSDSVRHTVQVAVLEGTVSLKERGIEDPASALLTHGNFGLLQLANNQITIENTQASNYLSWMTNRLVYTGQSLKQVSKQLEHLYNVQISFASPKLTELILIANFEKEDFNTTASIIASTFNIDYRINGNKLTWLE